MLNQPIDKNKFNDYLPDEAKNNNIITRKYLCILLLLDIKRCGDYEQVDSIKLIQDQNSIGNDEFGLRDIMFSTIDRLCSLYSRYKNTNVVWARTSPTPLYQFYRQPYIPLDPVAFKEVEKKRDFTQMKNKIITIKKFLKNVETLKPYISNLNAQYNEPGGSSLFERLRKSKINLDQSQVGVKFIQIMYDSIKNMVEFQNNSLFNKFFISTSFTGDNGTKPFMEPLLNISDNTTYNDDNYNYILSLYNNWCKKFYNIIDSNMYCWFDLVKFNKKIPASEDGSIVERIIPSYSVIMVNKTCHQFMDELTSNINPNIPYIAYYKNILQAKNTIENIYEQSGRQFWPMRVPRNDTDIIKTESVINLYKMFEGVMSSFDTVFNISNITIINKVKQVLNEITNKFDDGTLLMTRSQVTGSMERSVDNFMFDFKPSDQTDEDELFNLVSNMNMPTKTDGSNAIINDNYIDATSKIAEIKQTKKRKREEKANAKENKAKIKRDNRLNRLEIVKPLLDEMNRGTKRSNSNTTTIDSVNKKPRRSPRINKKLRRSPRINNQSSNQSGGNKIIYQTGGAAGEDDILGIVLFDNLFETPSIINQTYSDLLPLQLLQDFLDDFDIEYTGFDASNNFLTLSREEYMDDFITNLIKILENDIFITGNDIINDTSKYTAFKNLIITNYVDGMNPQEFIVSDSFTYALTEVSEINKQNLGTITWTFFLEKINKNPVYRSSIKTELESITNHFITDILNDKGESSNNPIAEYIKNPSKSSNTNDNTQEYVDYIFISLLWNGKYGEDCSFNTPEYLGLNNIPSIVTVDSSNSEFTPISVVNNNNSNNINNINNINNSNNNDLDSTGKWGDLLTVQSLPVPQLVQTTQQQEEEEESIKSITSYIEYLKTEYCNINQSTQKQTQKNNLNSIKRIKNNYGDVGIFYILSLIVNTISNTDYLYIPPISKDSIRENQIILIPLGGGERGAIGNITFESFFKGISGVYNQVASNIPVGSMGIGGSNKFKTHKKTHKRKHKRRHKGKTVKSKNIML